VSQGHAWLLSRVACPRRYVGLRVSWGGFAPTAPAECTGQGSPAAGRRHVQLDAAALGAAAGHAMGWAPAGVPLRIRWVGHRRRQSRGSVWCPSRSKVKLVPTHAGRKGATFRVRSLRQSPDLPPAANPDTLW